MNISHIKFGRSMKKLNMQLSGNEFGTTGHPFALVHDPRLVVRQIVAIDMQPAPAANSPVADSRFIATSPIGPPSYTDATTVGTIYGMAFPQRRSVSEVPQRRPVPQPPTRTRKVTAIHDFVPESTTELAFAAGDIIEILDDKSEDGWWKGRVDGRTGLIPNSFFKDVKIEDLAPRAKPEKRLEKSLVTEVVVPLVPEYEQTAARERIQKVENTGDRWEFFQAALAPKEVEDRNMRFPVVSPTTPAQKTVDQHEVSLPSPVATKSQVGLIQQGLYYTSTNQPKFENQVQTASIANPTPISNIETTRPGEPEIWGLNTISAQPMAQPTVIHTFFGHSKSVRGVAFSPSNNLIASASEDKNVCLWDSATGQSERTFISHKPFVNTVCFTPDSHVLASGSADKTVHLWDTRSRSPLQTLETSDWINAVAVSPDGRSLVAGLMNGKMETWDGRAVTLLHKLKAHGSQVRDVAFSLHDGGKTFASASHDKSVRTWDARSGAQRLKIKAHTGTFNYTTGVAFSSNGKVLASTS